MAGIVLGDRVKDSLTGYIGIAVCRSVWLHGCVRITIQSEILKDGNPVEAQTFDEPQVVVLSAGVIKDGADKPHGPRPAPAQKKTPSR